MFLKKNGAFEQDYVDYIAKNISGHHSSEQKAVLEIKSKFREFNKRKNTFETKKYYTEKGDYKIDFEPFSSHRYTSQFDKAGNLVFFEHQSFENVEWEDNGMHRRKTEQYYFRDKELYFYFLNGINGSGAKYGMDREYNQYRFYIKNKKKVIAAQKEFEDFFDLMPKEIKSIDTFKNSKLNDQEHILSADSILTNFQTEYNKVKRYLN